MKSKVNSLKQRLAASLEAFVVKLENEIKKLENIRCGREEYKADLA